MIGKRGSIYFRFIAIPNACDICVARPCSDKLQCPLLCATWAPLASWRMRGVGGALESWFGEYGLGGSPAVRAADLPIVIYDKSHEYPPSSSKFNAPTDPYMISDGVSTRLLMCGYPAIFVEIVRKSGRQLSTPCIHFAPSLKGCSI